MKCPLCGKRKAKRHCPAKEAGICPVCCGEKRGVEIACPLDCPYFVEGQRYQQEKVTKQRIKREGVDAYVRRVELYNRSPEIFFAIESAIVEYYRQEKELLNTDVEEALHLVSKTLETEESGLIYVHNSENPLANALSRRILGSMREMERQGAQGRGARLPLGHLRGVVREFENEVLFYINNHASPRSYLNHLARYHPEKPRREGAGEGIVLAPS